MVVYLNTKDVADFRSHLESLQQLTEESPIVTYGDELGTVDLLNTVIEGCHLFGWKNAEVKSTVNLRLVISRLNYARQIGIDRVNGKLDDVRGALEKILPDLTESYESQYLIPIQSIDPYPKYVPSNQMAALVPIKVTQLLDEAAICWDAGFDRACIILSLIAAEVLTREFYTQLKNEPSDDARLTWGETVNRLPGSEGELKSVLFTLVGIRNDVIHAKKELNDTFIPITLALCVDVHQMLVERMYELAWEIGRPCEILPLISPAESTIAAIILLVYHCVNDINREVLVRLLKGSPDDNVIYQGWDSLPGYASQNASSLNTINHQVDLCVMQHVIISEYHSGHREILKIGENYRTRAKELCMMALQTDLQRAQDIGDYTSFIQNICIMRFEIQIEFISWLKDQENNDKCSILGQWLECTNKAQKFTKKMKAFISVIDNYCREQGLLKS